MAGTVNETTAFKVRAFESNRWLLRESPAIALFTLVLLKFGDFPMMRRALKSIKSRAERASPAGGAADMGRTPRRSG
jgi:hypothetical protein